jgi:hypothetical protein
VPSQQRLRSYDASVAADRSTSVAVFPLDLPAGPDADAAPPGDRPAARPAAPSHRRARARRWQRFSRRTITLTVAATVLSGAAAAYVAGAASVGTPTSLTTTLSPGGSALLASGTSFADGTGTATFVLPGRPATDSLYAGVELRSAAGRSLYRAKARLFPSGAVSVDLSKVKDGVESYLGAKFVPGTVGTGTTTLTVQGHVSGGTQTTLQVRAWIGSTVPAWQYQATDGAGLAAGSVNAWAYLSRQATASMPLQISRVTATADGTSSPAPTAQPTASPIGTIAPAPSTTATASPSPSPSATTTAPAPAPAPSTGAPALNNVLANSGASSDTNYPIPAGALFVAPGGSGNGSQGAPFGTIAAAVRAAPSGGTIVLRGGLYREDVGGVGKPLTFQAYPHERPVLTGTDVVGGWAQSGSAWYTTNWRSPFGQYDYRSEEIPSGSAAGKVEQAYRNGTALKQVLTKGELAPGRFWGSRTTPAAPPWS